MMQESPMSVEKPGANTGVEHESQRAHQQEEEILSRQLNGSSAETADGTVFAYAAPVDIAVMVVSGVAAIMAGALNPLLTVSLIPTSCS
jgi:ATP-binding cassette subfamily B (MDR/TAP) protein 1